MTARTSARDVECPTCGIGAGLPCRSTTTGRSNTDTHKARHAAAVRPPTGPTYAELCAGYGGLGMGVQAVLGGSLLFYAEWDDAPSAIMAHHHPDAHNYRDVTAIDWHNVPRVDVVTAGFPCQPFSHAGKRLGANDERHLWPYIAEGIAILRPQLVLLENVRGLMSGQGEPDTDEIVELDDRLAHIRRALEVIGRRRRKAIREGATFHIRQHTDDSHRLMVEQRATVARARRARRRLARAIAAVLGGLADIGYDAQWYGLRAADVGAPHGRWRVFIFAWPADAPSDPEWIGYGAARHTDGAHVEGLGSGRFQEPRVAHGSRERRGSGAAAAADLTLLPTPAVNDMGRAYTPDEWDAWTDRMKAAHGNGNGHGKSLEIEAQRLLPTPQAHDAVKGKSADQVESMRARGHGVANLNETVENVLLPTPRTSDTNGAGAHGTGGPDLRTVVADLGRNADGRNPEAGAAEDVSRMRGADGAQEVREAARGSRRVPASQALLAVVCEHAQPGDEGRAPLAGEEAPRRAVCDLCVDAGSPRSPQGPGSRERRPAEPRDTLRELSPTAALAGGSRCPYGCGETCRGHSTADWREYEAAIRRWEVCSGRPAPDPTSPGKNGQPRLSALFTEWMMGLPLGHVTDPAIGITRNEQLKALGNGVVWQQSAAATAALVQDMRAEWATRAATA